MCACVHLILFYMCVCMYACDHVCVCVCVSEWMCVVKEASAYVLV